MIAKKLILGVLMYSFMTNAAATVHVDEITAAIQKEVEYPMVARMRGGEGQVMLRVKWDDAKKLHVTLAEPSKHPELDQEALRAAKKALKNRLDLLQTSSVLVPVIFRLATH